MSDVYLIWHCCGVDLEDFKEAAFQHYYRMDGSDEHVPHAVEGPGGEDLTEEAKRYVEEQDAIWFGHSEEVPETVGKIEIRERNSRSWVALEWIFEGRKYARDSAGNWGYHGQLYSEYRDLIMERLIESFGDDRVRFTPTD